MSDHPCEPKYEKMIDRAFIGDLSSDRWRELAAHLEECGACRAYHDRLGLIDEATARGPLTPWMRDRIREQVIGAAGTVRPVVARHRTPLFAVVSYATGALAVVVLAVMLPFVARDDEFFVRGGAPTWSGRPPGIGLFCITPPEQEGEKARVDHMVQAARDVPPVLACRLDQELQIAYNTPTDKKLFLTVQGETGDEPHWYAPRSPDEGPIELEVDANGQALNWSTRLGVHHEVGTIRVVARFYQDPNAEPVAQVSAMLEVRPEK